MNWAPLNVWNFRNNEWTLILDIFWNLNEYSTIRYKELSKIKNELYRIISLTFNRFNIFLFSNLKIYSFTSHKRLRAKKTIYRKILVFKWSFQVIYTRISKTNFTLEVTAIAYQYLCSSGIVNFTRLILWISVKILLGTEIN